MTPRQQIPLIALLGLCLVLGSGCATVSRTAQGAAQAVEGAIGGTFEVVKEKVLQLIEPKSEKFRRALLKLTTGGPDQRREAISYLDQEWEWSSEEAQTTFVNLLVRRAKGDPDELVRAVAARALKRYPGPKVTNALADTLADPNDYVRIEAARSLEGTRDANAVAVLVKVLRTDANPQVRAAAAGSLGGAATGAVLLALVEALDDDDFAVVQRGTDSLVRMTGEYHGETREEWEAWLKVTPDPIAKATPPPASDPAQPEPRKPWWKRILFFWRR